MIIIEKDYYLVSLFLRRGWPSVGSRGVGIGVGIGGRGRGAGTAGIPHCEDGDNGADTNSKILSLTVFILFISWSSVVYLFFPAFSSVFVLRCSSFSVGLTPCCSSLRVVRFGLAGRVWALAQLNRR